MATIEELERKEQQIKAQIKRLKRKERLRLKREREELMCSIGKFVLGSFEAHAATWNMFDLERFKEAYNENLDSAWFHIEYHQANSTSENPINENDSRIVATLPEDRSPLNTPPHQLNQ